jgi:Fe-Mn family superoxide dismutase
MPAPFKLPPLPWAENALVPYISSNTMSFHYGKHHKNYIDAVNKLVAGTEYEDMSLPEIIKETAGQADKAAIFNNAGQAWNHTFFWESLKPDGGGKPTGELAGLIDRDLGGYEKFRSDFINIGVTQFGSGWAWLVYENGKLSLRKTSNADTPIAEGAVPLLTIDVWEHAYYLDYQNRRLDFLSAAVDKLLDWNRANERLAAA